MVQTSSSSSVYLPCNLQVGSYDEVKQSLRESIVTLAF